MLFDSFMFFDELELLEIRLNELDCIVERFILVESDLTHSGKRKPLVFLENRGLFEKFLPKIIHVEVRDMPTTEDPWIRERWQRAAIMRGVNPCWHSYDLLISSDVDEIPKVSAIKAALPISGVRSLGMDSYGVFLNAYAGPWDHAKIGPLIEFRNHGPNKIRHAGHPPIKDAGWHFSSVGSPERISKKMSAFGHQEAEIQQWNNVEQIRENIKNGIGLFGGAMNIRKLDESFPRYLVENASKFSEMIYSGGADAGH